MDSLTRKQKLMTYTAVAVGASGIAAYFLYNWVQKQSDDHEIKHDLVNRNDFELLNKNGNSSEPWLYFDKSEEEWYELVK